MANRRFQTQRKRVMSWQGSILQMSDLLAGTPQFASVISEANLEVFPTPTLVRIRGSVSVSTDTSATAGSFGNVTMGIIKVTAAAFAAGAVPEPFADVGSDWIWWSSQGIARFIASENEGNIWRTVLIDSKSMRKVGLNEVVIFVASVQNCSGTNRANLCGAVRVLLKAP